MSFYDFVGKLVPGILIWAPWINQFYPLSWNSSNLIYFIIAFVVFYITGFIWCGLINIITKWMRRNPSMIHRARVKIQNEYINSKPSWIKAPYSKRDIDFLYVKTYIRIQEKGLLGPIPVLESHENFLKSIWLLLLYYIAIIYKNSVSLNHYSYLILISFLLLCIWCIPFIWYYVQMKIYKLVWETGLFLLELNNDKENLTK